ncbi:hypothetical protein BJV82DRAFT_587343 [Fennellomyces sp. T-0311]|nr:hypothetical protein BJV82DRAFT_587343 [Fennellomyces sp. T-0311]
MATSDRHCEREEIVTKAIKKLQQTKDPLTHQDIIDYLADPIAVSFNEFKSVDKVKSVWTRTFKYAAQACEADIEQQPSSWEIVENKINEKFYIDQPVDDEGKQNREPTTASKSKSKSSSLKMRLTDEEKDEVEETFASLNKERFWTLQATIDEASKTGIPAESVEEKIKKFAVNCNYRHPSQSFVIDLGDENWKEVFTRAELTEIEQYGDPLLLPVEPDIQKQLDELSKVSTAVDAYKFAQKVDHDPTDNLLPWLVISLMTSSQYFIKNVDVDSFMEADKQYRMFGFVNDIYTCSDITVSGKEKASKANASACNKKRKLSAVDEVQRKAMGRKMDVVYIGGRKELGCMEVGSHVDQTKEWTDGRLKMPVVMKDMLLQIVEEAPALLHKIGITGYLINGNEITLLYMDAPKGYITRIRRTKPISYPSCSDDFVIRIIPVLQLATIAKQKMEATLYQYQHTAIPLQAAVHAGPILPPCLSTTSSSSSPTSSILSTSLSSASSSKKQRQ